MQASALQLQLLEVLPVGDCGVSDITDGAVIITLGMATLTTHFLPLFSPPPPTAFF